MMTGCGSVLWMAPEILLGETYNESVDVFSYAMCMLELISTNLPWQGGKTKVDSTQVPFRVTRNERPTWQLRKGRDGRSVDTGDFMNTLIQDCWKKEGAQRPDTREIAEWVDEQYNAAIRRSRSAGGRARPEIDRSVEPVSRPASRSNSLVDVAGGAE